MSFAIAVTSEDSSISLTAQDTFWLKGGGEGMGAKDLWGRFEVTGGVGGVESYGAPSKAGEVFFFFFFFFFWIS